MDKDVTLTPGFVYVEVYAAYNTSKEGGQLMTKTGFPMCSLSLSVVDQDANVGKKSVFVPSNMTSKIINIENAFGIANLFDNKTNCFSLDKIVGRSAGAVIVPHEKYGVNFEMFVPLAFYELSVNSPHVEKKSYSGVQRSSAQKVLKGEKGFASLYTKLDTPEFDNSDIPF